MSDGSLHTPRSVLGFGPSSSLTSVNSCNSIASSVGVSPDPPYTVQHTVIPMHPTTSQYHAHMQPTYQHHHQQPPQSHALAHSHAPIHSVHLHQQQVNHDLLALQSQFHDASDIFCSYSYV